VRDRIVEVVKEDVGGNWNKGPERTWIVIVAFTVYFVFGWNSKGLVENTDTPAVLY
jgi:hypothetical protein